MTINLSNTPLAGGSIEVTPADVWDLSDVLGQEPPEDHLHPLFAFIAAQRGIGVSVADLCSLANFDVNDGPLLGSVTLTFEGDLLVSETYEVSGQIDSMVRKHGRSGTFDLLNFSEHLLYGGQEISTSTVTFVLPRKDQDIG